MTGLFLIFVLIPMLVVWFFLLLPLYYIAKRLGYTNNKKKLTLFMCSPLMVMGVLLLAGFIYIEIWGGAKPQSYHMDKDRIERITGVRLPDFEMIDFKHEGTIDFTNTYTIEFKEELTDEFYEKLDSLVSEKRWTKNENNYSYHIMWGNGYPAPEGENEEDDGTFGVKIEKGSKKAVIEDGVW